MMTKKQKVVVLGIIRNDKDEVLVIQRFDPGIKDAHLKWDVPGGTSEFGESLEETLIREISEEVGLEVEVNNFIPKCVSKNWNHAEYIQHTLVFCYECRYNKGEIRRGRGDDKVCDVAWMGLDKVLCLDLLPTTREFVEIVSRR